jgi:hypothetical protein
VDCLIVDPHGNVTLPVEQFFDPHHQNLMSSSRPSKPTASIESGQHRERHEREGPGNGRPSRPVGQPRSNWTTRPVHTDRTDTPNLGDWEIRQGLEKRTAADVRAADITVRQAGSPRTDSIFVDGYAKMTHPTGSKLGQEYAFRAVLNCWRLVLVALPCRVDGRSFPGDFRRGIATLGLEPL